METASYFSENRGERDGNSLPTVYRFFCTNKACTEKLGGVFQIEIPFEAIMDEKNMAMPFCRKCGKPMSHHSAIAHDACAAKTVSPNPQA